MEFWKIYRIVKARRWMILGLLLITLATVAVAYRAISQNTQYVAQAVVLPSQQAYAGVTSDTKTAGGIIGPSYSRLDKMAQFIRSIKAYSVPAAIVLSGQSPAEQKRAVVQASADNLFSKGNKNFAAAIENPTVLKAIPESTSDPQAVNDALVESKLYSKTTIKSVPKDLSGITLDDILQSLGLPTDRTVWVARSGSAAEQNQRAQELLASLTAGPEIENSVNEGTPQSPTPVTTDYIQVGLSRPQPNEAIQMANLVAAAFINNYKTFGVSQSTANVQAAVASKRQAETELKEARKNLTEFKEKNYYVNLNTSESVDISNLQGLERSRDSAQVQLAVAQKDAAKLNALAQERGPTLIVNLDPKARPHYQQLQEQIADAQASLDALGSDLTPANPQYQRVKAHLDAVIKERDDFLKQPYVSASPNPEYQALKNQADAELATAARAQQTINELTAQINEQRAKNEKLPGAENTLADLIDKVNEASANVKSADEAVRQLTNQQLTFNQGQISMVSAAAGAMPDISGPGLATLLIYGAILSLLIGIAVAVGLDYLDNSVQTIPDAEKLLGMPVSAVIPAMPPGDPRRLSRLAVSDPLSPIAESYRLLRTDLLFTAEEKPFKSLMAATAKPGQGATTTICNLAVALATVGKRVILIDADLRRPKLHSYFNVSNETGLTSLLRDECELEEALKVTDIDNLLVLPSGPLPLNPAELLASQKMRALHERLKPHTDFVLIDTPSAIAFSDSSILASYLDAVMIVVRAQETPRGSEIQLKQLLNKARANVVGVVLNGVKPQLVDSYYYHAAYYPQVTPNGHSLEVAGNGGVLPPPNGHNGHDGGHKTLEGEDIADVVSSPVKSQPNIEATAVLDESDQGDIVTVTPPKPRSRFNFRRRSGDDELN